MSTEIAVAGHHAVVTLTKFYELALHSVVQEKALAETLAKQSGEQVNKLQSELASLKMEDERLLARVAELETRNARLVDALERANAADPDCVQPPKLRELVDHHDNA